MNPQNKPLPKPPMREPSLKPPVHEPRAPEGVALDGPEIDEAAKRTPVEKEHADYGGEHFDLKTPKKERKH